MVQWLLLSCVTVCGVNCIAAFSVSVFIAILTLPSLVLTLLCVLLLLIPFLFSAFGLFEHRSFGEGLVNARNSCVQVIFFIFFLSLGGVRHWEKRVRLIMHAVEGLGSLRFCIWRRFPSTFPFSSNLTFLLLLHVFPILHLFAPFYIIIPFRLFSAAISLFR
ncbi:hypothetical protein FN846DRAFT_953015 [Sphaerosporella brunnea]|uniref:Transmembrane protein n=1 Tax=Sphaerosporella brunnea TaxID=1250544 RepID=A0A5J5EV37_9PEZI|nr:hypothetical protein FN846DRAFT_953015 [Sphaerosporella brunnea]